MSTFQQLYTEDRRLVLLRVLAEANGYEANSSILQRAAETFGHNVSRDVIHTDLAWLAEQGLLTTDMVSSVVIATLNHRGLDVAKGRSSVPGVKKPGPV